MFGIYAVGRLIRGLGSAVLKSESTDTDNEMDGSAVDSTPTRQATPPAREFDTAHWSWALTCGVCMQYYRMPIILGCGHTFCRRCISKVAQFQKTRFPQARPEHVKILCPECRAPVRVNALEQRQVPNYTVAAVLDSWMHSSERHEKLDKEAQTASRHSAEACTQTTELSELWEAEDLMLSLLDISKVLKESRQNTCSTSPPLHADQRSSLPGSRTSLNFRLPENHQSSSNSSQSSLETVTKYDYSHNNKRNLYENRNNGKPVDRKIKNDKDKLLHITQEMNRFAQEYQGYVSRRPPSFEVETAPTKNGEGVPISVKSSSGNESDAYSSRYQWGMTQCVALLDVLSKCSRDTIHAKKR